MSAPEHHDKHFLNLVSDGLKQPHKRFQYTCLLFYGIRRSPPPTWIRRLPRHSAIKELLQCLDANAEATSLVAGVMVVIVLVTAVPQEVGKYCLGPVLDMFWRMAHWSPKNTQDSSLRDYLRVALYSLFTRLYALFPCNVVNYIRTHTVGMFNKPFFLNTLQPMIERVRLHPMLFTFTKELELDTKVNPTRDCADTLMDCNRLSLDPVESTCEEPPLLVDPEACTATFLEAHEKCWVHSPSESIFWSPSHYMLSPNPRRLELPPSGMHTPMSTPMTTPIYTPNYIRTPLRVNISLQIPESPPEAAIEATPETTPYTTPLLSEYNRQKLAQSINKTSGTTITSVVTSQANDMRDASSRAADTRKKNAMLNKLTAVKNDREQLMPPSYSTDTSGDPQEPIEDSTEYETNIKYSNRRNLIASERRNDTNGFPASSAIDANIVSNASTSVVANNGMDSTCAAPSYSRIPAGSRRHSTTGVISDRSRKRSVFVQPPLDMLQFTTAETASTSAASPNIYQDYASEVQDQQKLRQRSEEKDSTISDSGNLDEPRKISSETNGSGDEGEEGAEEQGLGPPPVTSMTELVKTAKSNRLRFLSQCGPPLNISQIESIMPEGKKEKPMTPRTRTRSKSCSYFSLTLSHLDLHGNKNSSSTTTVKLGSSIICKSDAETQTQASSVIDPYERLVETFLTTVSAPSKPKADINDRTIDTPSPHALLQNYIQRKIMNCSEPLLNFDFSKVRGADEKLRNQVYSMYSLLLLERHKREVHANRNRRLLETSKHIHVLLEERNGLKSKTSALCDEMHNVKSANIYFSNSNKRLEEYKQRDIAEKDAVLKLYSEGKSLDQLCGSVLTSLSRTVKTSKGEDHKEKVIVILHRPLEHDEDKMKDQILKVNGKLAGDVRHLSDDNSKLQLRVLELEQDAVKFKTEQENIEVLQQEKEVMRQHMAIMRIQLTLKDELNLEASERVNLLEEALFDVQSKHRQDTEAWNAHENRAVRERLALRGMACASNLRLSQLEQKLVEKDVEYSSRLKEAKEDAAGPRSRVKLLEQNTEDMRKQKEELEMRLMQVTAEKDMLNKELQLLASRSGYSRTSGASLPTVGGRELVGEGKSNPRLGDKIDPSRGSSHLDNYQDSAMSKTGSNAAGKVPLLLGGANTASGARTLSESGASNSYFNSSLNSELKPLWQEPAAPNRSKK